MGIFARIAIAVILLFTVSVVIATRPVASQALTAIRLIGPSGDGYTPAWAGRSSVSSSDTGSTHN